MFRRLAVFGGSFSLVAAEAVATTNDVRSEDVLELVAQLLKKSLVVVQQGDGELRYRLLETLSEYGREKLLAAEELTDVRDRHLRFFSGIAEAAFREWRSAAHAAWLHRLSLELENLRLALDWAREQDRGAWVRLSGALAWFWLCRSPFAYVMGRMQTAHERWVARARSPTTRLISPRWPPLPPSRLRSAGSWVTGQGWQAHSRRLAPPPCSRTTTWRRPSHSSLGVLS